MVNAVHLYSKFSVQATIGIVGIISNVLSIVDLKILLEYDNLYVNLYVYFFLLTDLDPDALFRVSDLVFACLALLSDTLYMSTIFFL